MSSTPATRAASCTTTRCSTDEVSRPQDHGIVSALRLRRPGGITVEFVATLPMILAALAIVFEFGRGLWYHQIVTKGVRDATRYAARYPALGAGCATLDEDSTFLDRVRHVALSGRPDGTLSPAFWTNPATITVQMTTTALDLRTPEACTVIVRAEVPHNLALLTVFSGFWNVNPGITITVQDQARYIGD